RRLLPSPVGAVIASPGDRADAAIVELGRVAGSRFDWLVVKEDADRRGRATGEVARLLCQGAQSAERGTALRVEVVLEEAEAVRRALQICPPGGTVVVFYEKYAKVVGVVEEWAGRLSLKDMDAVGENA
ncbi:MAG TPA: cyanophycin synthetase, partial [Firmicutes bacterium]|nr:cyanophycin synthetase [Bacillota bacterium]